jgi:hypothetical protein
MADPPRPGWHQRQFQTLGGLPAVRIGNPQLEWNFPSAQWRFAGGPDLEGRENFHWTDRELISTGTAESEEAQCIGKGN